MKLPDPHTTSTGYDTDAPIIQLTDLPEEPYPFVLFDAECCLHGWADWREAGEELADWLYVNAHRYPVGTIFRVVASEPAQEQSIAFHPYLGNV